MASSMGKKAKHDDGISGLSDSLLSLILSLLPIKDAVATSILSSRWRNLYAYMVSLDVDFQLFRRLPPHTLRSLMNFMDRMLFVHAEGRMEQFRLHHIDMSWMNDSNVCGWISAALWRGVKEIGLAFAPKSSIIPMLPTALLFTSKTLVTLRLEFPYVMVVPIHVCLPCLKTLELQILQLEDDDSAKRLFSSCPVLEELSITCTNTLSVTRLVISIPSLKSLILRTLFANEISIVLDLPSLVKLKYVGLGGNLLSMGIMPSLVKADIYCFLRPGPISSENVGFDNLFEGIGNVKSLRLTIDPRALPFLSHKRFSAFQNLLHLHISRIPWEWNGKGVFEFLEFTPNLQSLVIGDVSCQFSFPTEKVPACVVHHLREFEVKDFGDESSLLEMVTYILNNATLLEELKVGSSILLKPEQEIKITKQLLKLPRRSHKCQVIAF